MYCTPEEATPTMATKTSLTTQNDLRHCYHCPWRQRPKVCRYSHNHNQSESLHSQCENSRKLYHHERHHRCRHVHMGKQHYMTIGTMLLLSIVYLTIAATNTVTSETLSESFASITSDDGTSESSALFEGSTNLSQSVAGNNSNQNTNLSNNSQQQQSLQDVNIQPFMSTLCGPLGNMTMPLGMQSGEIDDQSLTASSAHNYQSVGPHLARLNQEINGGAWCPRQQISANNYGQEWIQIELNRSHVVSAIETQGRYGGGLGVEYVSAYQIEYSRDRGNTWHKYRDYKSNYLLKGNDNAFAIQRNELRPPIVGANVIKILPFSQHLRTVCMRLELYGCLYDESAPIAYAMIDGARDSRLGRFKDATYDGHRNGVHLTSGLGQLVDGVKGADHYKVNGAFEWVGWYRGQPIQVAASELATAATMLIAGAKQAQELQEVVIEFEFETVRNFSSAKFYSNNMFSANIEVFSSVEIHYGIDVGASLAPIDYELARRRQRQAAQAKAAALSASDDNASSDAEQHSAEPGAIPEDGTSVGTSDYGTGKPIAAELRATQPSGGASDESRILWSGQSDTIEYMPDRVLENARDVVVHLNDRLANRLRFVLKFAAKWILVSEVKFFSSPVELLSLTTATTTTTPTGDTLSTQSPAITSISEHTQQVLLDSLATCQSYDEYLAVLRTNQLRHRAAVAFTSGGYAPYKAPPVHTPIMAPQPQPSLGWPAAPIQPSPINPISSAPVNDRMGINWPPPPPPSQPSIVSPTQRPSSAPAIVNNNRVPASSLTNNNYVRPPTATATTTIVSSADTTINGVQSGDKSTPPATQTRHSNIQSSNAVTSVMLIVVIALTLSLVIVLLYRWRSCKNGHHHHHHPHTTHSHIHAHHTHGRRPPAPIDPFTTLGMSNDHKAPLTGMTSVFAGHTMPANGNVNSMNGIYSDLFSAHYAHHLPPPAAVASSSVPIWRRLMNRISAATNASANDRLWRSKFSHSSDGTSATCCSSASPTYAGAHHAGSSIRPSIIKPSTEVTNNPLANMPASAPPSQQHQQQQYFQQQHQSSPSTAQMLIAMADPNTGTYTPISHRVEYGMHVYDELLH